MPRCVKSGIDSLAPVFPAVSPLTRREHAGGSTRPQRSADTKESSKRARSAVTETAADGGRFTPLTRRRNP
jgi:hypothetical protein